MIDSFKFKVFINLRYQLDNVVGAIGFVSRIIPQVYPISIIKADPDSGEPIRGKDGLCQKCKPHEPGVFIGNYINRNIQQP